jgi:hypothetical protein
MADARARRLASILPARKAVGDDLTMITRAVRLAAKYDMRIDGSLWEAMVEGAPRMEKELSPHRVAIEALSLAPLGGARAMLDGLRLSTRMWNNIPVDDELDDEVLRAINQVPGISGSCAGHHEGRGLDRYPYFSVSIPDKGRASRAARAIEDGATQVRVTPQGIAIYSKTPSDGSNRERLRDWFMSAAMRARAAITEGESQAAQNK